MLWLQEKYCCTLTEHCLQHAMTDIGWLDAISQVTVPGRPVDDPDMTALHRALDKTYNISAGQKVVEVFENIRHTVQMPVQSLTGSITAGLKEGMLQAKQLLKQAADKAAAATQAAKQQQGQQGRQTPVGDDS